MTHSGALDPLLDEKDVENRIDSAFSTSLADDSYRSFDRVIKLSSNKAKQQSRFRWFTGCYLVLLIVFLFTANSELIATVDVNYHAPYVIIWFNHVTMTIFVPVFFLWIYFRPLPSADLHRLSFVEKLERWRATNVPEYTPLRFIIVSFALAWLLHAINVFLLLAYERVNVATGNSIYQAQSALVYILSICVLNESVSWQKAVAVFLTLAGVAIVGIASYFKPEEITPSQQSAAASFVNTAHYSMVDKKMSDLIGLLEAVGSAIASAFYAIFFRKYVGSLEQSGSFVILILGMIGVWHVLVIWTTIPLANALSLTGQFQLPTLSQFWPVLLVSVISLVVNTLTMIGYALIGPLFVSVGISTTIPASFLADYLVYPDVKTSDYAIVGAFVIFAGFILLNVVTALEKRREQQLNKAQNIVKNWGSAGHPGGVLPNDEQRVDGVVQSKIN